MGSVFPLGQCSGSMKNDKKITCGSWAWNQSILHDWSESNNKRIPNNDSIMWRWISCRKPSLIFWKVGSSLRLEWYSMYIFVWFGPRFATRFENRHGKKNILKGNHLREDTTSICVLFSLQIISCKANRETNDPFLVEDFKPICCQFLRSSSMLWSESPQLLDIQEFHVDATR